MRSKLTTFQKDLLTGLAELYENSKTYTGTNQVKQSFAKTPSQIFSEYNSDYVDFDLVHDFEEEMKELEEADLIHIEWKNGEMYKLIANPDVWTRINKILNRTDKNTLIKEQLAYYQSCIGCHAWLDAFCQEQIDRLQSGKKARYGISEAKELIDLLKRILFNTEELLERELSILTFSDSKKFEKSYRSKVCRWLRKYGDFESLLDGVYDSREAEQIILGEYNIFANPSYVYFKGRATIVFESGNKINLNIHLPVALSSVTLEHVVSIQIYTGSVMTIENLTSFNRMSDGNYFYIFLSGYHNTAKQNLLTKIYGQNPHLKWFHFGDMDPDGFYIVDHLKRGTGIPFELYLMSIDDLKKYEKYSRPLEKQDKTKANSLIAKGKYLDVMEYMLNKGCKLEQEIISLELSKHHQLY